MVEIGLLYNLSGLPSLGAMANCYKSRVVQRIHRGARKGAFVRAAIRSAKDCRLSERRPGRIRDDTGCPAWKARRHAVHVRTGWPRPGAASPSPGVSRPSRLVTQNGGVAQLVRAAES